MIIALWISDHWPSLNPFDWPSAVIPAKKNMAAAMSIYIILFIFPFVSRPIFVRAFKAPIRKVMKFLYLCTGFKK